MLVDRAVLDEAVRRFPRMIWCVRAAIEAGEDLWLLDSTVEAIQREYRLILADRAKGERKVA